MLVRRRQLRPTRRECAQTVRNARRVCVQTRALAVAIVYSSDADADRAFFRDVLEYPHGEVAVHPADAPSHELYLMCDDLTTTVEELAAKGVTCGAISDQGWGLLTSMRLPGGGELGLYEPRHPTATAL